MGASCNKNAILSSAEDVLFSVKEAAPLIATLLPEAAPKIQQAISIAQKLRDSISASQSTEALGYLQDLIPVFQDIVQNDVPQIHDPNVRTTIMVSLALANIGLHYIVKNLVAASDTLSTGDSRVSVNPKKNAVYAFDKEPVWGNYYKYNKRK